MARDWGKIYKAAGGSSPSTGGRNWDAILNNDEDEKEKNIIEPPTPQPQFKTIEELKQPRMLSDEQKNYYSKNPLAAWIERGSQAATNFIFGMKDELPTTGSKVGDFTSSMAGNMAGFTAPVFGTSSWSAMLDPISKGLVESKIAGKLADSAMKELPKRLLPIMAREGAEDAAMTVFQGGINKDKPSQIALDTGLNTLSGAAIGGLFNLPGTFKNIKLDNPKLNVDNIKPVEPLKPIEPPIIRQKPEIPLLKDIQDTNMPQKPVDIPKEPDMLDPVLDGPQAQMFNIITSNLNNIAKESGLDMREFYTSTKEVNGFIPSFADINKIINGYEKIFSEGDNPQALKYIDSLKKIRNTFASQHLNELVNKPVNDVPPPVKPVIEQKPAVMPQEPDIPLLKDINDNNISKELEDYYNNLESQDYINSTDIDYVKNENKLRQQFGKPPLAEIKSDVVPDGKKVIELPKVTIKKERLIDGKPVNPDVKAPEVKETEPPHIIEPETYKKPTLDESAARIYRIPVNDINVDPERFQFKLDVDSKTGAGKNMQDIQTWNEYYAGIITAWQDKEGKLWVVNGHHRLNKAKQLGVDALNTRVLKESDGISAKEAREMGAQINIAENSGSVVDAAKVFRDGGYTLDSIKHTGLSLKEGNAKTGYAIAQLNERLFNKVILKHITPDKAALIGEKLPTDGGINDAKQNAIFDMIDGKRVNLDELSEMIDAIKDAEGQGFEQQTLLGVETVWGNVDFNVKPKLIAEVKDTFTSDKNTLAKVIKKSSMLEKAGNKLDTENNEKLKQLTDIAIEIIDKGKNKKGDPIDDIFSKYTAMVNGGMSKADAGKGAAGEILSLIERGDYFKKPQAEVAASIEPIEGQFDMFGGVTSGQQAKNPISTTDIRRPGELKEDVKNAADEQVIELPKAAKEVNSSVDTNVFTPTQKQIDSLETLKQRIANKHNFTFDEVRVNNGGDLVAFYKHGKNSIGVFIGKDGKRTSGGSLLKDNFKPFSGYAIEPPKPTVTWNKTVEKTIDKIEIPQTKKVEWVEMPQVDTPQPTAMNTRGLRLNENTQGNVFVPPIQNKANGDVITPPVAEAKPNKPISAPPPVEEGKLKTSKHYSNSYMNTEIIPDEAKKIMDEVNYKYGTQTNEGQLKAAQDEINRNGIDAVMERIKSQGSLNSGEDSMAHYLITKILADEGKKTGDYDDLLDWTKIAQGKVTNTAQALQALSQFKNETPEGALMNAQKVVDNVHEGIKKTNPKLDEKINTESKQVADDLNKVNKEAADELSKELEDNIDGILDSKGNDKLTPEEILAKRVEKYAGDSVAKKPDLEKDMINTLFNIAKKELPEKAAAKRDPLELIREALQNKNTYHSVWNKAKDILKERYSNDPATLGILDDYFEKRLRPVFETNKLNTAIRDTMKSMGIDLGKIVRESYTVNSKARTSLVERLTKEAYLSGEDAEYLEKYIRNRMKELTKVKKEQILGQMFKDMPTKKQKSVFDRIIELSNLGAFDNTKYKDLIYDKYDIPTLSKNDVKYIMETMDKAQSLSGREKEKEVARVMKFIADKIPATLKQKVTGLQRISLILNPKTLIARNPGGNIVLGAAENIKDLPGALIDKGISQLRGSERTTIFSPFGKIQAQGEGLKKGFLEWLDDYKSGVDTSPTRGQMELPQGRTFKNPVLNAVDEFERRVLNAGDRPFYQAAYESRIYELKKIKNTNVVDESMMEDAKLYALDRVFQNDSYLSQKAKQLKEGMGGLGPIVMPFTQTPSNVMDKLIDYTPAGLIKALYHLGTTAGKGTADNKIFNQKLFVDRLARMFTGTGLGIVGYVMAKKGMLTGKPNKDKDVSTFEQSIGKQSYAFKIGDKYYSYDWAQPIGGLIAAGADAYFGGRDKKDFLTSIAGGAESAVNTVLNQSFLQGMVRLMSGYSPAAGLSKTLLEAPTQAAPTAGKQVAQLFDPFVRDTYDSNIAKRSMNKVAARLPMLSKTLPVKMDAYGQPVKSYQGNNNIWNVMINPGFNTTEKTSPVEKAIMDVYKQTGATTIFPRVAKREITYRGNTFPLDEKQYQEYQELLGKTTLQLYQRLVESTNYSKYTPELKQKAMERSLDMANEYARNMMLRQLLKK